VPAKASTLAVGLFTCEGLDSIRKAGGSVYWQPAGWRFRSYEFVLLMQNLAKSRAFREVWPWATGENPHSSAFALGKLADLVEVDAHYRVTFSEIAPLDPPIADCWPGGRTTLRYDLRLEDYGINPAKLAWEPVTQPLTEPYKDAPADGDAAPLMLPAPAPSMLPATTSLVAAAAVPVAGSKFARVRAFAAQMYGVRADEIELEIRLR